MADIGAGTAKLTKLLCENNLIVSAVEPNQKMRFYGERNTKKFTNLNWSSGTGEETTLKSNSIYCMFFGSSFNTLDYKKALGFFIKGFQSNKDSGGFPFRIGICYENLNQQKKAIQYYCLSGELRRKSLGVNDDATQSAKQEALRLAKDSNTTGR